MANINFNVEFSTFINWYFGVANLDELTPEQLTACGFDNDYYDFSDMAEIGVNDCESLCTLLKDNYNGIVNVEIVPDKMNDFATITIKKGVSFEIQCDGIDEFFAPYTTDKKHVATYRGKKLFTCNVFGRVLYCSAIWEKYPEFFVYCANYDAMIRQIDFVSK